MTPGLGKTELLAKAQTRSMMPGNKLAALYDLAASCSGLDGDAAEVGVCRGGSTLVVAAASGKRVHGFDTFTGLPSSEVTTVDGHGPGSFYYGQTIAEVQEFLAGFDVRLYVGTFPETARSLLESATFSFVHVDSDLYLTTRKALEFFWPRMTSRGIMAFDDYNWQSCKGIKLALDEFTQREKVAVTVPVPNLAFLRKL